MIIEEKYYLEHFGKKGMKWGTKGTKKVQKRLDRTQRIGTGTASFKDRALGSALTAKGANRQLQRGANRQAKMSSGKMRVTNRLNIIGGVRVKDLDFHKTGDAKAKMDGGQKMALASLAAIGTVGLVLAKR